MSFKQHFRTGTIKVGEGEEARSFEVSQWLPAGTLLASLEPGGSDGKTAQEIVLTPGAHVEYSADKRGLLAVVSGYPRMTTKKEGSARVVIVEIEPLLAISEDGWSVKLNLYPPFDGYPAPAQQQIVEQLEQADIRWGVREKAIAGAHEKVHGERTPVLGLVIARGRMPVNGQNGKLRIEVQVGEQPGREQSDGSIDFKERNVFIGVDAGQLLATRIAATAGLSGINVFGQEVPQTPGKDLSIKSSADIVYDERTGQIRAACGGVVSVVNDTTIKVTSKQVIPEDIDFTTGNVRSKGGVEVGGSVRPGFMLKAGGDVLINGIVESGQVAGANVIARGGVTGKQSIIEAGGDVFLHYLEEGRIICQGAVHIAKEAYFAEVRCLGSLTSGAESRIIGSKLYGGASLSLFQVDTDSSPHSSLAAAVDYERFERLRQLTERRTACEEVVFRLRHRLGPGGTSADLEEHEEELADCRRALQDFNLIPVSADDDTSGGLRFACAQKIEIAGIIQAGATIRIGNSEAVLKHSCREGFFALNSETQKIAFYSSRNPLQNIVL